MVLNKFLFYVTHTNARAPFSLPLISGMPMITPDEHGPGAMHAMRAIKHSLDPDGLMNPGKVLAHRKDPKTGRLILCA